MSATRFIVITSIFPPTEAVIKFAAQAEHQLIVAGDRKSPTDWHCENVLYLSAEAQAALPFQMARQLPWNHYCRKMMGYLTAMQRGAAVIVDTDDDNIPKPGWAMPEFDGAFSATPDGLGFVNVYQSFTKMHIWPRGFPLERVTDPAARLSDTALIQSSTRVGVWQGLADGDPDVDAIYRLTSNAPCFFDERPPLVLGEGTACPFNSQNTAFRAEAFPLLYLPAFVTFRFTDILRGLVAQPILWAHGLRLGFTSATVIQERNPHDYLKDFESEIPCYLHPQAILDLVQSVVRTDASVSDNLRAAYDALRRQDIVTDDELTLLAAWLDDVQSLTTSA